MSAAESPARAFARDEASGSKRTSIIPKRIPVPLFLPNLLGYARIVLAFVGLHYAIVPLSTSLNEVSGCSSMNSSIPGTGAGLAVQIWILSAFLDLFDGYAARRLNQRSKFGILLDILADNVLRTATWIAAASVTAVSVPNSVAEMEDGGASWRTCLQSSSVVLLAVCGIICLEWTTMLCTQLKSVTDGKHWKVHNGSSNPSNGAAASSSLRSIEEPPIPALVAAIFRNNFRSPIGILSIYGMFSAGMWTYGSYFAKLRESIPLFQMWWALSIVGRILSMRVELWLCWSYLRIVLAEDESMRREDDLAKVANGKDTSVKLD